MPIEHDGHQHPEPTEEQLAAAKLPYGFPLHDGKITIHIGKGNIVGVTTEIMVLDGTTKEQVGTAITYALAKAAMLIKVSRGRELMVQQSVLENILRTIGPEKVEETINEVMDEARDALRQALGIEPDANPEQPATTPVPDVFRSAFGQDDEEQSNGG